MIVLHQGSLTTSEMSTQLRFKEKDGKRILQQLWVVAVYDSGVLHKQHGEWRDVECVGPDAPDTEGV